MHLDTPSLRGCFITGTDTDAGKTTVTAALLRALHVLNCPARAIKPVQTGCEPDAAGRLRAPDALRYAEAAGIEDDMNQTLRSFLPACSPHLAAELAGTPLDAASLAADCRAACGEGVTLFEGAGGLFVPLNRHETMLDLMARLRMPVLLVAGNRLGCINHALLSLNALQDRGLSVIGMVLCRTAPTNGEMSSGSADEQAFETRLLRDNAATLAEFGERRGVPLLAELPYLKALNHPSSVRAPQEQEMTDQAWRTLAELLLPAARLLLEKTSPKSTSKTPSELFPPSSRENDILGDEAKSLLDFDRRHLWHPYTSASNPLPVQEVTGTEGTHIRLRNGRELVDGMSSWWCAIHGYRHPVLMRALREQAARFPHIMFGGLTHEPAVELGRRLLPLLPTGLEHIFFADSGSVAVEVAIKMAIQYWRAQGQNARTRLVALRGGYHGDSLGAMSVCDPVTGMHSLFSGLLPVQLFAERPACRFDAPFDPSSVRPMRELLQRERESIAAVIVEPIVQGAGGMWFYHPEYLRELRLLCDELDILLIADEIATGFGRTGKLFASEWAEISPDILCLGKALTGGTMTLSATASSDRVAFGISSAASAGGGAFMHGPTFMGNPLACAVACASVDLLLSSPWQERIRRIEQALSSGLAPCRELPDVADVRTLGAIGVVELHHPVNVERLQQCFLQQGVWIRPFNRTVYLMPPYVMKNEELGLLTSAVFHALSAGAHK